MDLDISNYMQPRWWNRSWGWISFFPHNPDYQQPPFDVLLLNLRRYLHLPDNSGYSMPDAIADSWFMLDSDISAITSLLQVYYDLPAMRPMNPRAFGFHNRFRHQWMVATVINKSKDWFSVWVALLSYLIAKAESKEYELQSFPGLAKKSWYNYLLEKGVERTWLDSLASSVTCRFHPDTIRTGIFLRLPVKDSFQPSVDWFCRYKVPVWYAWGKEQAQDPRFASFAPLTHQLQIGTTILLHSPSPCESVATDNVASTSTESITSVDTIASGNTVAPAHTTATCANVVAPAASIAYKSPIERYPHSWIDFFASREALNKRLEMTETTINKQKRLSREKKPPTQSAKVFRWVRDLTSDRYIREKVSKKWRQDTLADYSLKQTRYDSFSNEWDCSSQFGSDDESENGHEDPGTDEEIFVDYDEVNNIPSSSPTFQVGSRMDPISTEHDGWFPFSSTPRSTDVQPADAIIEEELLETANIYFGYTGPIPLPSLPALTDLSRQKAFLHFFGFSWAQARTSLFSRPKILALHDFISRISSNRNISDDSWDLSRESRSCPAFTDRFRYIREISGPNGPLFMLDLGERATVKWILTLTAAADALLVCRLHPQLQEKDIALYLLRTGVPFYTLQDANTLCAVKRDGQRHSKHPYRPANHDFTILDYTAYVEQCEIIFGQPRARAALLRGGYLWRVSVTSISFDDVLEGPSGRYMSRDEMLIVTLPNGTELVDDALLESEILLLLGMYNCSTGTFFLKKDYGLVDLDLI